MPATQRPLQILQRRDFATLFEALARKQFRVVGPTVRDQAIVFDAIQSVEQLPIGWTDEQDGGQYRLRRRADAALFGYNVGPHSMKRFLHPPRQRLWQAVRQENSFTVIDEETKSDKTAYLGVRACDLRAVTVQDNVFLRGQHVDKGYQARRENTFIIAVNCGQAGGTCFCVSMGSGPKANSGFDLALTEIIQEGEHYFLVEIGSEAGGEIAAGLPLSAAAAVAVQRADEIVRRTAASMGRQMDTQGIKELLYTNLDHPRWDDVASRCLTCANCTMVCPTCFCSTVEDTSDLAGTHAERWQRWDSCFTMDFSSLHGAAVRSSPKSRYRQWMTHKLASWIDQFGTSGCVGCGRCITWCPVGIDITEEVQAIRDSDAKQTPDR